MGLAPADLLRRANLAAETYAVMHMSPWALAAGQAKVAVATQLPAWTPLKRKVLGLALRYAGEPYVWGGTSPDPQSPLGSPVAGGFDCSGFVWWAMSSTPTPSRATRGRAIPRSWPARRLTWPRSFWSRSASTAAT